MYDIQLASKITATHCSPEGVSMRYRRRGKKIGYERFESVRVVCVCEAITASSMLRLIRNDVDLTRMLPSLDSFLFCYNSPASCWHFGKQLHRGPLTFDFVFLNSIQKIKKNEILECKISAIL
jgi:hypothetical protein